MPATLKARRGKSQLDQERDDFMAYRVRVADAIAASVKASETNRQRFLAAAKEHLHRKGVS